MNHSEQNNSKQSPALRTSIAVLIGLFSCLIIWIGSIFTCNLIGGPLLSDDYLPISALMLSLLLALCINPLLGTFHASWKLNTRQMTIILGMMLVGSFLSGQGLMKTLPHSLAGICIRASTEQKTAELYQNSGLKSCLFPDKLVYNEDVIVSDRAVAGLLSGESIPWKAWIKPLFSWLPLFAFYGMMMIGLARIVTPQWRDNERISFPLLEIYRPLVQTPEGDSLFTPIFRLKKFWGAAGAVFLLHFFTGAQQYWPGSVPAIPLEWNLSRCFTDEFWLNSPWYFNSSKIYFTYVGIAFFLTTRISFSIWFTMIGYGIYQTIHTTYFPPYVWDTVNDHRSGVVLVLVVVILWLGRARWKEIACSLIKFKGTGKDRQNCIAGWMFLSGMLSMAAWFFWAGTSPGWALLFVCTSFIVCLLISRVVAETGLPFLRIFDWDPLSIMKITFAPFAGTATVFLAAIATSLYHFGSRISGTAMATEVFALENPSSNERTRHFNSILIATIIIGTIVVGSTLVYLGYRFETNIFGEGHPFTSVSKSFDHVISSATAWQQQGVIEKTSYNRIGHIALGAGIAGILMWLCMNFPAWPLHPVGFLMLLSYYGEVIWASVCLGWLLKTLIVRYGGSRMYTASKPFFLGLIFGELIATMFWFLLPLTVSLLTGQPYNPISIRP